MEGRLLFMASKVLYIWLNPFGETPLAKTRCTPTGRSVDRV